MVCLSSREGGPPALLRACIELSLVSVNEAGAASSGLVDSRAGGLVRAGVGDEGAEGSAGESSQGVPVNGQEDRIHHVGAAAPLLIFAMAFGKAC